MSDPVEEFLARERDELGEIGFENEVSPTFDVQNGSIEHLNNNSQNDEKSSLNGGEVPEKIRKWKEDQITRLKEKDLAEEKAKENLRKQAEIELLEWSKRHEEIIKKTKLMNRNAEKENIASEPAETESEDIWERIAKLCDFAQSTKSSKACKDNSRMRLILLQLKQMPLEKA